MPSCSKPEPQLKAAGRPWAAPKIMGVINVTPDSFYSESRAPAAEQALDLARRLREDGADIIDIGGQSARPGSAPVPADEEIRRVIPAVRLIAAEIGLPVSVDTDKAEVARLARLAGAAILNDVSALRAEPELVREAVQFGSVILMHRGGKDHKTMQDNPAYADVVAEVAEFLAERLDFFVRSGGDKSRVLVDPGIGFGKTPAHNLSLLKHARELGRVAPVVLGVSRKSFLSSIVPDAGPESRLPGSLAAALWAAMAGAAVLRVHDAGATRRALATLWAIDNAR